MSKRVCAITKIIPKREREEARFDIAALTFAEAYTELQRVCPSGDLRIHLSIEADTLDEAGD